MHPELEKYNYNRNIKPFNKVMTETFKKLGIYDHLLEVKIKRTWAETAGTQAVKYTAEIKVIKNRIYAKITSAALRQELLMRQSEILEKINNRLNSNLEGIIIY